MLQVPKSQFVALFPVSLPEKNSSEGMKPRRSEAVSKAAVVINNSLSISTQWALRLVGYRPTTALPRAARQAPAVPPEEEIFNFPPDSELRKRFQVQQGVNGKCSPRPTEGGEATWPTRPRCWARPFAAQSASQCPPAGRFCVTAGVLFVEDNTADNSSRRTALVKLSSIPRYKGSSYYHLHEGGRISSR